MSTAATNRCPRCYRGACDVVRPCSVCGYVVSPMKKPTKPKSPTKPKRKPSAKPKPSTPEITEYQAITTLERLGYVFMAIKPKRDQLTTGINLRTGVTRQLVAVKLCAPIESEYGAAWAKHYTEKDV